MKVFTLFFLLLGIIFITVGYLELHSNNTKNEKQIEYRVVPRAIYDQIAENNLDNQFNYMFNSNDARNSTNLI
jgi:hypothetical protein